jgi:hypothetical protein
MGKRRRGEQLGLQFGSRVEPPQESEVFDPREPLCYHCGQRNPDIWSGRLQSSVHSKCHESWLKERRVA